MTDPKATVLSREWMTTEEVKAAIGKSERRIQEFAQEGRLRFKMSEPTPGVRSIRLYDAGDVKRLIPANPKPARTPRLPVPKRDAVAIFRPAAVQDLPPTPSRPLMAPMSALFFTLEEASLFSGLTATFLRKLINENKLFALKGGEHGTWRISRTSLENFAGRRRFR